MRRRIGKDKHCPRTGKIRYRDEASARHVVKRAKQHGDKSVPIRWYECDMCGGWHTTSQPLRGG